jgi:hypothetical protein
MGAPTVHGSAPWPAPAALDLGSLWIDQRGSEVLPRNECLRLLALADRRRAVGRLALPTPTSPIVVPLNFRYCDQDVLVRVGPGTVATTAPGRLVAFEVDRVEAAEGWAWSVLVRGLARSLAPHDLHRLWRRLPEPLAPEPGDVLIAIRSDQVTGRRFRLVTGAGSEAGDA